MLVKSRLEAMTNGDLNLLETFLALAPDAGPSLVLAATASKIWRDARVERRWAPECWGPSGGVRGWPGIELECPMLAVALTRP
jgi:hypothetical protein